MERTSVSLWPRFSYLPKAIGPFFVALLSPAKRGGCRWSLYSPGSFVTPELTALSANLGLGPEASSSVQVYLGKECIQPLRIAAE